MQYRADLFTSSGRIQYYADTPELLRGLIQACPVYVMGWSMVEVATKRVVDYQSIGGVR